MGFDRCRTGISRQDAALQSKVPVVTSLADPGNIPMKTFKTLLSIAVLAAGFSSSLKAAPIPSAPIHTNKLKFRIPFHYNPAELSGHGAREIRLYDSRDRGLTWKQIQSVAPDAGKFNFQAPVDGEYWFIVRTLDATGRLVPGIDVTDPGLKVIVDTTLPSLQLQLRQPAPGKVQLNWTASDEHLDLTQLRMDYIQPGSSDWQPISVVPKAVGQAGWTLPQGGMVVVRGSVADLAKNVGNHEVRLSIAPGSQTVPRPDAPGRQPVAGPLNTIRDPLALSLPDRFPSSGTPEANSNGDATDVADNGQPFNSRPSAENASLTNTPKNSFVSLGSENHLNGGGRPRDPSQVSDETQPTVPSQTNALPPRSGRPRVVNSRRFQIGYKLQDVGPSGVSSVELFITPDDGKTWYRYGVDDDNQSPFQVEVPREGTYGFTLGVRSGAGLTSDPPQNGDVPAIVVAVDLTPPRLEILSVEQGRGKNFDKLLIAWNCSDDNLGDKPILLFYSTTGRAPWLPIAGSIPNTGHYVWKLDPRLAPQLHLRIEARDLAGNTQTSDSPQPVLIDLSRPTAKIIGVEPPEESGVPR